MQQSELKVSVSLAGGLYPMWLDSTGIRFSGAFLDRLYDKDEYFRERIILLINELAGDQWSVHFTEYPVAEPIYHVDITADDQFLGPIMRIIAAAFPEVNLEFWKPRPYVHIGTHRAKPV